MSAPEKPLLFPEAFDAPGLWKALGTLHDLTEKDFRWLAHARLASDTLRSQQTPPMRAERILLTADKEIPVQLPGSFVLGTAPDDNGEILYTPFAGLEKFSDRAALQETLEERLNKAEEADDLLAFFSLVQRKRLLDAGGISLSFETIAGDIFEERNTSLLTALQLNAQTLCDELRQLPSLGKMLESALDELLEPAFGNVRQSGTRVTFHGADKGQPTTTSDATSLTEAVLIHYRHQSWPDHRPREFSNPGHTSTPADRLRWEEAVVTASSKLPILLFRQLDEYWHAPSVDGSPRCTLFRQMLEDQARTELMLKRDARVLDAQQFQTLVKRLRPDSETNPALVLETVRLWEYRPNFIELAGSLMVSGTFACLYTPSQGLQMLKDYADLKTTLQAKFLAPGHEDELYALLGLDERNRFLGFDQPQVSGARLAGNVFNTLFEAILAKQRQNVEYALQVFRHSDGAVELHALFDKALDIRSMIHERLMPLNVGGRWSTSPALSGSQQPSIVLADTAMAAVKTFNSIEWPISQDFSVQPLASSVEQRRHLDAMKSQLAHALFVGIRGEARLRALNGSLPEAAKAMVETVFDADRPSREERLALNGFRPDAYSLTVTAPGDRRLLPLAGCVLITERGGLDTAHSGRAVLWTPALGLELFGNVATLRKVLDRRLLDSVQRLTLVENLAPTRQQFHQRYTLGPLNLIPDNVLYHCAQSGIDHFMDRCDQLRTRITEPARQGPALLTQLKTPIISNLQRAKAHAQAISQQQTLPAWLSMASPEAQRLHVELLEQWRHSIPDSKDYLDGVTPLDSYVAETLKALLDSRFPGSDLDPRQIEITPNLALAGPARNLVEFAQDHVNVAQGTGFKVTSNTGKALPDNLDQTAVRQLLSSLAIASTYSAKVTDALTANDAEGRARKQRFIRQLPWQLLQHAHALQLQQQLSASAFDCLLQIFDMPDGIARATVQGAHGTISPLSLVKTTGASAVTAQGLYLIECAGQNAAQTLLTLYGGPLFREFENETALIAAFNTPGELQDLLLRRLPDTEQAGFRNLFQSSRGQVSEISLSGQPIDGNALEQLFEDNTRLLKHMLGCQAQRNAQSDWETAKTLVAKAIRQEPGPLPGKLSYIPLLWQAYEKFKGSAQALQDHHWMRALKSFVDGAAQMVQVAFLPLEPEVSAIEPILEGAVQKIEVPGWSRIRPTSSLRTRLQPFETSAVALKDLTLARKDGTYSHSFSNRTYAAVAGKVYQVIKNGSDWQMAHDDLRGPILVNSAGNQVLNPARHIVQYGKAISKMYDRYTTERERREIFNIEAEGMDEIRNKHPHKARMLMRALDLARFYAFNCLHNLAVFNHELSGTRLHTLIKGVFDVPQIGIGLLDKLKKSIIPICKALVDPTEDWLNSDRFVVGSNKFYSDVIAFVLDGDAKKKVHFTEKFFDQQLDWYKSGLTDPLDVDSHAQAATLIHEFAHQFSKALDIASMEARRPFTDLISTVTGYGLAQKESQQRYQRQALSLATPREALFCIWNEPLKTWLSVDNISALSSVAKTILELTGKPTLKEARQAFYDQNSPDARINVILRNADSLAFLICGMGRQLDPVPSP
ncbi:dermonecrotic toxin domain-containing protein [Pseudomonas koreensis]|uniref:Dermonecrotic toxin N-terminal domain-containing protein n=1 Tax=Pseudomonas koreensis TaxID=198620 RepID=A0A9X3BFI5_9PSED|nr:DUF6543 domain-containing protein [Pseudomonas koreensis]MCU7251358.1 hypothetical protein [Pseudomonas koreensis]